MPPDPLHNPRYGDHGDAASLAHASLLRDDLVGCERSNSFQEPGTKS